MGNSESLGCKKVVKREQRWAAPVYIKTAQNAAAGRGVARAAFGQKEKGARARNNKAQPELGREQRRPIRRRETEDCRIGW